MTPIEVKNSLVGVLKGGSKETPTKETLGEFFLWGLPSNIHFPLTQKNHQTEVPEIIGESSMGYQMRFSRFNFLMVKSIISIGSSRGA
jgi:hypothetical protein